MKKLLPYLGFLCALVLITAGLVLPQGQNFPGGSSTTGSLLGNPAYTGLVATRAGDTNNNVNAGVTWIMDRSMHIARQNLTKNSMKIVWGNFYVDGSSVEHGPGGTATFKYSIEYPLNTITLCTIGGQTTANVLSATNAISDACNPAIPNGAAFWIRTLYTNAAGIIFVTANFSSTLDGAVFGSGAPTDLTGGGNVSSGGGVGFHPAAIIGTTLQPSVCLVGDSRVTGQGDTPNDLTLDTGEEARSIGPTYPYIKIAVPGTSLGQAINNFTLRLTIAKYCNYAVDAYGINDIGGGASAVTLAGNRTTMAGLLAGVMPTPATIFGTTLLTETTSSDSWATTTNQTGSGNPSIVQTFNGLVRAGISGEANYLDIANALDPTAIGKFPVSPNLFATSGTAGFCTVDGVHETNTCNQIIARLGTVNVNWFTY